MTGIRPNRSGLRLDPDSYRNLWRQVLERDNWTCQVCGSKQNLQIHHRELRSQQGGDEEFNLVTLCVRCHGQLHRGDVQDELFTG